MDKKILDKAEVKNADAIIMGVAHDANPKDVSVHSATCISPQYCNQCCPASPLVVPQSIVFSIEHL